MAWRIGFGLDLLLYSSLREDAFVRLTQPCKIWNRHLQDGAHWAIAMASPAMTNSAVDPINCLPMPDLRAARPLSDAGTGDNEEEAC